MRPKAEPKRLQHLELAQSTTNTPHPGLLFRSTSCQLRSCRNKSGRSLTGQASGLSRSDSVLTTASSCASLASMTSLASMPSMTQRTPSTAAINKPAGAAGAAGVDITPTAEGAAGVRNVLKSTPFASPDAARAVQQEQQQQGGGRRQPELIGFVLLDPMWENNEAVGYVSSIVRMKRSAHQGELKLLPN